MGAYANHDATKMAANAPAIEAGRERGLRTSASAPAGVVSPAASSFFTVFAPHSHPPSKIHLHSAELRSEHTAPRLGARLI